jgi:hypothetical protein
MISYSPPAITDHGSLVDLTADFDLTFVGSVVKAVSLAAVSPVIVPGGGEVPAPNNTPGGVPETVNVLGGGESGGTPQVPVEGPEVLSDVGSGPGDTDVTGAPVGGAGDAAGSGGSGGGGSAAGGGGGGGDLPFTGYYASLSAGAGAALTTAGLLLRSKLRRKS